MKRAATYTRVSTRKEEQDTAFEASIARLRDFARSRFTLAMELADRVSGAGDKTQKRVAYQRLLEAARRRDIDVVVVTRLDRLARSLQELVRVGQDFAAWGVDLVVLDQPIDTTTPAGRLMFHLLAAFAEFERDLTRDRILQGVATARARGRVPGPKRTHADLVPAARRMRAEGETLGGICRHLALEGHAVTRSWVARACTGIPPRVRVAAAEGTRTTTAGCPSPSICEQEETTP